MRGLTSLSCAFCGMLVITFLSLETRAQDNVQLPPPLSQRSSVSEIVEWLDKNSFGRARIGVKDSYYPFRTGDNRKYSGFDFIFASGFKLVNADGCNLTLRNDEARMINRDGTPQSVELFLPLARMSDRKGKAPYRHTRNPLMAKLFGTWRTEFKERGFFTHGIFTVRLKDLSSGQSDTKAGDSLKFTFDDRDAANKFNVAFRQAIKLCTLK